MKGWLPCVLATSIAHGAFVAPTEGPPPFRRDRLPLDAATMRQLAGDLVAQVPAAGEGPAGERRAAQLIALALALDPSNRSARDWIDHLEQGEGLASSPAAMSFSESSRAALDWLSSPDAGPDAAVISLCLSDVFAAGTERNENGRWSDWVAPLAAFQPAETETTPEPDTSAEPDDGKNSEVTGAKALVEHVALRLPIWFGEQEPAGQKARAMQVNLKVRTPDPSKSRDFSLQVSEGLSVPNGPLSKRLQRHLNGEFGKLAQPLQFDFEFSAKPRWPEGNQASFAGGVFLMAEASFRGVEIQDPPPLFLAAVEDDGRLTLPPLFWEVLRQLGDDEGARLVLPEAAAEMLPSMITLDRGEFFLEHEVLLAADLEEALQWVAADRVARLAKAEELFHGVRGARGTRSLGSFLSRGEIRQQLAMIGGLVPQHASARMLALRGTSQWPRRLPRNMYAREIRAALMSLEEVLSRPWSGGETDVGSLLEADARCRERLDEVEDLCESVDDRDELHSLAFNTSKSLGTLAGQIRRNERDSIYANGTTLQLVRPVYRDFREAIITLTAVVGDSEDFPLPAKR